MTKMLMLMSRILWDDENININSVRWHELSVRHEC